MKEQMIKRAVKLNEIFERRGLSLRVVYDKISVMNEEDKETVETMNATIVNAEDKLTDNVYIVSDGMISIA